VRCLQCNGAWVGELNRVWTPEKVVAAIREWADEYGAPPAIPDWSPRHARDLGDEGRAVRFERAAGRWPSFNTAIRVFGSWNAGIRAAGYEPRPVGRPKRERAAA
jgi:hypothetical protein